MKFNFLIATFAIISASDGSRETSRAIGEILREISSETFVLDVVLAGNQLQEIGSILNDAIRVSSDFVSFNISTLKKNDERSFERNTLMLFDSIDTYVNATKGFRGLFKLTYQSTSRYRCGKLLIYCHGATIKNFSTTFLYDVVNLNVNFLIDDQGELNLATVFRFTAKQCSLAQLKVINSFDSVKGKWQHAGVFIKKYANLHGCKFIYGVPQTGSFSKSVWFAGDIEPSGYEVDIFRMAAKKLNFTLSFKLCDNKLRKCTLVLSNYSEQITNKRVDHFLYHPDVVPFPALESDVIDIVDSLWFVPPGEEITLLEKLFRPLQLEVWIAMAATMIVGFAFIQIINRLPVQMRDLVYGENVHTPTLNLLTTFVRIFLLRLFLFLTNLFFSVEYRKLFCPEDRLPGSFW